MEGHGEKGSKVGLFPATPTCSCSKHNRITAIKEVCSALFGPGEDMESEQLQGRTSIMLLLASSELAQKNQSTQAVSLSSPLLLPATLSNGQKTRSWIKKKSRLLLNPVYDLCQAASLFCASTSLSVKWRYRDRAF